MKTGSNIKISQILRQFWFGIRPNKTPFLISYIFCIIVNIINIFVPLFYKKFFDLLGQGDKGSAIVADLFFLIAIIALMRFVMWIFWRISDYNGSLMMSKIMSQLKQNSFSYLLKHSYSFFSNSFSGGLVQKVNRFTRAFESLSNSIVYQVIPLVVAILGSVIVTYFIAPVISYLIITWAAVFVVFSFIFSQWKLKYDVAATESDSVTTGYLSDCITNNNSISLFTGHNYETDSFKRVANEQARKTKISWYLSDTVDAVQSFLIFSIEFFVFYYTLKYWSQGLTTIGTFVLAQTYIIGLANQFWSLNRTIRTIYQSLADAKEMVEILETPYEIKDCLNAKELIIKKGGIAFKNISFSFNKNHNVLDNLSLDIKPGEKVALVGPSGSGKTTFIRLLMRLYDLANGKIEIDGQDISQITQESLRNNISLVPQDPVLFHRTLMENIRYGRRDATDEEVIEAAKLAHCDDFIDALPLKYETFVGERGIKLSGGERQRVAIARAILKNAPILILDEATSSLDSHSEALIQKALNNLMKNCTTIAIAHRLSTIRRMDRIIVMKDGKIIEDGTHEELSNKNSGLYKDLWELQAGGFIQK